MFGVKSSTETQNESLHTPTTGSLSSDVYNDISKLSVPSSVRVDIKNPAEKYYGWYLDTRKSSEGEPETAESDEGRINPSEPEALYLVDPLDPSSMEGEKTLKEQGKKNIKVIHTQELQEAMLRVLYNPFKDDIEEMPIQKTESCFLESVYKKPVFELISNQYHERGKLGCDHSFIGLRYTAYIPSLKTYVRKCVRFGYNGNLMLDTNSAYEGGVQKKIDYDEVEKVFQDITDYFKHQKSGRESPEAETVLEVLEKRDQNEDVKKFVKRRMNSAKYYYNGDPRETCGVEVVNCFTFARDIARKRGFENYFNPESEVYNPQSLTNKILGSLGKNEDQAKHFITEQKATAKREKRKAPLNAQGALTDLQTFHSRYGELKRYGADCQDAQYKMIAQDITELQELLEDLREQNIDSSRINKIKTTCTSIRKQILDLVESLEFNKNVDFSDAASFGEGKYHLLEFAGLFSQIRTQLDSYDVNMLAYLKEKPDNSKMEFFDQIGAVPSPETLFVLLLKELNEQMEIEEKTRDYALREKNDVLSGCADDPEASISDNEWSYRPEASISDNEWSHRPEASISDNEWSHRPEASISDDELSHCLEASISDNELSHRLEASISDNEWSHRPEASISDDELSYCLEASLSDGCADDLEDDFEDVRCNITNFKEGEQRPKSFREVFFEKIKQNAYYKYVLPSFYERGQQFSKNESNIEKFIGSIPRGGDYSEILKNFDNKFIEELYNYMQRKARKGYRFKDSSSTDHKK